MGKNGEGRGGGGKGLGTRHVRSGKLLDAHCFELAIAPSEAICLHSEASSGLGCSRLWLRITYGVSLFFCLPCQHKGDILFEMGTSVCLMSCEHHAQASYVASRWVFLCQEYPLISSHSFMCGEVLTIQAFLFYPCRK